MGGAPGGDAEALARHDELVRDAIEARGGHVVKTTGDGFHAAFATAHEGLASAVAAQRDLGSSRVGAQWGPLRVRMGLHTGAATLRDGDYFGTALNRAARLMSVAHGGQVVVFAGDRGSRAGRVARGSWCSWIWVNTDCGTSTRAEQVFQVTHAPATASSRPLLSFDAFPGNLPLQVNSFIGQRT